MKMNLTGIGATLLLSALLSSSCEKIKQDQPDLKNGNDRDLSYYVLQAECGQELKTDLFIGKNTLAGQVIVTQNSDGTLKVTYQVSQGFLITETHLSVTSSLDLVPQTPDHNPKVGQFSYSMIHDPGVTMYVYDNIPAGKYILAHALIKQIIGYQTNIPLLDIVLPSTANMSVTYPTPGGPSYFQTTVTDGGILNGKYQGWCIDVDHVIYQNTPYQVSVYSSYGAGISDAGLVDFPENLDKVNWILNQDFVGKTIPALGTITYGDVQRAIWVLLESNPSTSGLDSWSQDKVNYILSSASAGEGFVPQCGNVIAIILKPFDTSIPVQITVTEVALNYDLVCQPVYTSPETAWAAGYDFGGHSWAKYFTFCFQQSN